MKKFIQIIMLALLAIFASNTTSTTEAFGQLPISKEQMVQDILENPSKRTRGTERMVQDILQNRGKAGTSAQVSPVPIAPRISEEGIAKKVFLKLSQKIDDLLKAKEIEKKTALKEADSKTSQAIKEVFEKVDTKTATAIKESGDKAVKESNSNAYLLLVALAIGFIGLGVLIYFRTKRIEKKVDDVPTTTSKLVKELNSFTFSFESRGHHVTCTPSIDGGAYNSFHVPTSVKSAVSDSSKIKRSPITSQGKLRRWTQGLMDDFFDGKFNGSDTHSVLQTELIKHVQATGEVKIA